MKEDVIVYCVCSSRPLSLMITVSHVFNGQRDGYTPAGRTHPGCLCQLAPHKINPDEGDAFYSCFKSETVSRTSSRPGQVCSSRYHGDGARLKEGHRCVAERSTELTNTLICLQ